jgi:hypothetical protein
VAALSCAGLMDAVVRVVRGDSWQYAAAFVSLQCREVSGVSVSRGGYTVRWLHVLCPPFLVSEWWVWVADVFYGYRPYLDCLVVASWLPGGCLVVAWWLPCGCLLGAVLWSLRCSLRLFGLKQSELLWSFVRHCLCQCLRGELCFLSLSPSQRFLFLALNCFCSLCKLLL